MKYGHLVLAGRHLLLVCLALGLATPAFSQLGQGMLTAGSATQLQGTLSVEEGSGYVADATVRLEVGEGRVIAEQPVSANGQFSFTDLSRRAYTLIATARGCETYVQQLDLTTSQSLGTVNIILRQAQTEAISAHSNSARTDASVSEKARKELERGIRASKEGKLYEAEAHFEEAVKLCPCFARAQVDLALTRMQQHDLPNAEAPLKHASKCDPDFVAPYLHLGRLFNAEHRYLESRRVLAEGIRRAPTSWLLHYYLGQAEEGLKNYALAESELLRALSFGAGVDPSVHANLADVYLGENAYDKAYAQMNTYLQADPDGPFAAKMRAIMQQLESRGLVHPS